MTLQYQDRVSQIIDVISNDMVRLKNLMESTAQELPSMDEWVEGGQSSFKRHRGILKAGPARSDAAQIQVEELQPKAVRSNRTSKAPAAKIGLITDPDGNSPETVRLNNGWLGSFKNLL